MDSKPADFNLITGRSLALAHTLTCLTYAWRINRYSCKTFSFLWEDHGFSEAFAGHVETLLVVLLLLGAICIWIRPVRWFALLGAVAMSAEMLSETFAPGAKYPGLYWGEWMMRIATPVAANLLLCSGSASLKWSVHILRTAIALTFAAHGVKALLGDPRFIDFLLVFFRHTGIEGVTESRALLMLHVIGTIDLLLAAHLLFFKPERNRMVLIWMAVWGLVTACSRVVYGGVGNWHEVLIRSAHFLMPITLLWLIHCGWQKTTNDSAS